MAVVDVLSSRIRYVAVEEQHVCIFIISGPNGRRYEVVGTRPIRHDEVEKVTGQARYRADIRLPGMLYGKVLRSPHAHARIKVIDTSRAAAFPGVHAVVTAAWTWCSTMGGSPTSPKGKIWSTLKQLVARQVPTGGPIMGRAAGSTSRIGECLTTHIVDMELDPETGKVQILRFTAVQNGGKAIPQAP